MSKPDAIETAADAQASPIGASLAARLRIETRDAHEAIERNAMFASVLLPTVTRSGYARVLARLLGFYEPVERQLATYAQAVPAALDLPRRLVKADLLRRDLAALAGDPDESDPFVEARARIRSVETAWGWLYVLEGATMGGQLIARHLADTLGLDARSGTGFHLPYGPLQGQRWRRFKDLLDLEAERRPLVAAGVVGGARDAFEALGAWME